MGQYTTKPVDAVQWNKPGDHDKVLPCDGGYELYTRRGWAYVDPGDWIITLADGESYPCKPDVFEAKYRPTDAVLAKPEPGPDTKTLLQSIADEDPGDGQWFFAKVDRDELADALKEMGLRG